MGYNLLFTKYYIIQLPYMNLSLFYPTQFGLHKFLKVCAIANARFRGGCLSKLTTLSRAGLGVTTNTQSYRGSDNEPV